MSHDHWVEILIAISPGLVLAIGVFLAFFVFLMVDPGAFRKEASRRHGTWMVPKVFVRFFYWFTEPIATLMAAFRIHPNYITAFSLVLAIGAGSAIAMGHFMVGFWLFFGAIACDLIDGVAARSQNISSQAGAMLDSWIDRTAEGAVLAGLAIYGRDTILLELSLWALVASVMVSYSRARGQALGIDIKQGLMQRPERTFVLCWAIFLSPLVAIWVEPQAAQPIYHAAIVGVAILAFLSTITAFNRLRWTMLALHDGERGTTGSVQPSQDNP